MAGGAALPAAAQPGVEAPAGAIPYTPVGAFFPPAAPVTPNVNVVFTLASRRATLNQNSLLLEGVAPIATFVATEPILNAGKPQPESDLISACTCFLSVGALLLLL
jgi:hypothetical protein